jgi:hypothetical protein
VGGVGGKFVGWGGGRGAERGCGDAVVVIRRHRRRRAKVFRRRHRRQRVGDHDVEVVSGADVCRVFEIRGWTYHTAVDARPLVSGFRTRAPHFPTQKFRHFRVLKVFGLFYFFWRSPQSSPSDAVAT